MLPLPHVLRIPIALCKYGLDVADNDTVQGQKRTAGSDENTRTPGG